MCGIAGLIAPPGSSTAFEEQGKKMQVALTHRGPDSRGMWTDAGRGVLLVHDRLAIQDLSEHGHQPMRSHSGRYCIAFNGEIYNFRQLGNQLASAGYTFSGHSDTEILLAAIEEWGLEEAIKRSNGMFAFALWDARNDTLSLCRDRLGEKPLYYGWSDNRFYFASELKAIEAATSRRKLQLDFQGLRKYLQYGYITAPDSIYRDIYKLVPGTIFTFTPEKILAREQFSPHPDTTGFAPEIYWSVRNAANQGLNNIITDDTAATAELDNLLHETIRMQTIADVGVGVFLSGGIDSSTVAAIAQSEASESIRTFSIGFEEKEFDESIHAKKVAQHLGTNHSVINVTSGDTLRTVPELPSIYDEPFADSSQIPTYIVSGFARNKVAVCLSGDGGDELFAGYNRYISTDRIWNRLSAIPLAARKTLGNLMAIPGPGFWDKLHGSTQFLSADPGKGQKLIGLKIQKLSGLMQQRDIMSGYDYLLSYWNQPDEILSGKQLLNSCFPENDFPETGSFIDKAMYLDQTGYLEGDNLVKVDRASMAVSLETRLPLLNHKLVELSWRIPLSMKVRNNTSKWILRQVLYKYVPRQLIDRPKMGFSVPVAQWLRGDLMEWAGDMLGLIRSSDYDFLKEKPILTAWNEHLSGKYDHSQKLWTVLMLLSWLHARR